MPTGCLLKSSVDFEAGFIDDEGKEHLWTGSGTLAYAKPLYLYLILRCDGIAVVQIGSNGERYWVRNEERKEVWWGKFEHLGKPMTHEIPIQPNQLIAVLGMVHLPTQSDGLIGPVFQMGTQLIPHTMHPQYELTYFRKQRDGTRQLERTYSVSRVAPFLPERIIFGSLSGQIGCEATLDNLRNAEIRDNMTNGATPIIPHAISLRVPKKNNFLILRLHRAALWPFTDRLRPPERWEDMRPPRGWKVIQIDKEHDQATSATATPQ